MYHPLLTDARFHNSLFDLDRLIAEQVRQAQCPQCFGNLNQSNFPRKPRGVPEDTHPDYTHLSARSLCPLIRKCVPGVFTCLILFYIIVVCTIIDMEITYNTQKDLINRKKHGISLTDASLLEWEYLIAEQDIRFHYDDIRMLGYAPIGREVYCVVFTEENDHYHIISLRKADKQEVRDYASQI